MSTVLSEGAKRDILDLIKRGGELTLDHAARELRLAKTTVRQHLLSLEQQGLVTRKYERAGQGRPKVVFDLSPAAQRLYPTQEPALLRELLEYLKATGKRQAIEGFFERYWAKRYEQFESILASLGGKKDLAARIEALQKLLESEGFMPKIERKGQRVTVRECNCPFPEAIRATQLPCRLESELIRRSLNLPVERAGYIPNGDAACIYTGKAKS